MLIPTATPNDVSKDNDFVELDLSDSDTELSDSDSESITISRP